MLKYLFFFVSPPIVRIVLLMLCLEFKSRVFCCTLLRNLSPLIRRLSAGDTCPPLNSKHENRLGSHPIKFRSNSSYTNTKISTHQIIAKEDKGRISWPTPANAPCLHGCWTMAIQTCKVARLVRYLKYFFKVAKYERLGGPSYHFCLFFLYIR